MTRIFWTLRRVQKKQNYVPKVASAYDTVFGENYTSNDMGVHSKI